MPDVTINITRKRATPAQKSVGTTDLVLRALHKGCQRPVDAYCAGGRARGQSHG